MIDAVGSIWHDQGMEHLTLLDKVRAKLAAYRGAELANIGAACGMSEATIRRIQSGQHDPAFSRVQQLAAYFRLVRK